MMTERVKAVQDLLNRGETEKGLAEVASHIVNTEGPEKRALYAEEAWLHYRRKEWDQCQGAIALAGDNRRARECLAQFAAYHLKDPILTRQISQELPGSAVVQNAAVILARSVDGVLGRDEVLLIAGRFESVPTEDVTTTNVINNCGRYLQVRSRGHVDLVMALKTMAKAIPRYGQGLEHEHHRAGAYFHTSRILYDLVGRLAALIPAMTSVTLWESQVARDPTNKGFAENLKSAQDWLNELQDEI